MVVGVVFGLAHRRVDVELVGHRLRDGRDQPAQKEKRHEKHENEDDCGGVHGGMGHFSIGFLESR